MKPVPTFAQRTQRKKHKSKSIKKFHRLWGKIFGETEVALGVSAMLLILPPGFLGVGLAAVSALWMKLFCVMQLCKGRQLHFRGLEAEASTADREIISQPAVRSKFNWGGGDQQII